MTETPLRTLLVALLIASAAAFAGGVALERSQRLAEETGTHAGAATAAETTSTAKSEAGHTETSGAEAGGETTTADPAAETTGETAATLARESGAHKESSEKLLGIDPESTGLVLLALLSSLTMAALAWRIPRWPLPLALIAFAMLAFAALDVREVVHQINESRTGVALVAGIVTVLHLAAAAVATRLGRRTPAKVTPASSS